MQHNLFLFYFYVVKFFYALSVGLNSIWSDFFNFGEKTYVEFAFPINEFLKPDLNNVDSSRIWTHERRGGHQPESEKAKTFRIARFSLQKLSG